MSFERDPMRILQNEILKTKEARIKLKSGKKRNFNFNDDESFYETSDQEFINDYIRTSDYFPECD